MKVTDLFRMDLEVVDRLFLIGPPGIGKTEVIEQYAKLKAEEMSKIFINLRDATEEEMLKILEEPEKYFTFFKLPATHLLVDDLGYLRPKDGYALFVPPLILKVMSVTQGIFFIDEITNVHNPIARTALYAIIQEKEASWNTRFPKQIIILAGNPPEFSADAELLPEALQNRVTMVNVTPTSVEEWVSYMLRKHGENFAPEVINYLMKNKSDLFAIPSGRGIPFPSPRSWEALGVILPKLPKELWDPVIDGRVGPEVGMRFKMFLSTKVIDVEELIENPWKFEELKDEERYAVMHSLASNLTRLLAIKEWIEIFKERKEFFMALLNIALNLSKEMAKELRVLLISNPETRKILAEEQSDTIVNMVLNAR